MRCARGRGHLQGFPAFIRLPKDKHLRGVLKTNRTHKELPSKRTHIRSISWEILHIKYLQPSLATCSTDIHVDTYLSTKIAFFFMLSFEYVCRVPSALTLFYLIRYSESGIQDLRQKSKKDTLLKHIHKL